MSIKKLFESTDRATNYLPDTTKKDAFKKVESGRNVAALSKKQKEFIPQIDYSDPANFARYGSAFLYYESAVDRILDYYPYDGSDAEINEFHNKSLDIEKYIFNEKYPRTNGYVIVSADGWGTQSSTSGGYGLPATLEYITFYGGPGTASSTSQLPKLFNNPKDSKFQYANIYDTAIYQTAGQPSNYGSGSRESNLMADFDRGVTVEFWLKTGSLSADLTTKQVIFDLWNNEASSSADYGRITIELTGTMNIAATATIVGTAALAGEAATDFKLVNADGTVITFRTNATKNFGDTVTETASPFTVNTGGSFSSDGIRKATQALWISCKAAIDNGVLDCTISPTTVDPIASGQEYFTLTQTTAGSDGDTAITLITGVTANGETNFTGGFDETPFLITAQSGSDGKAEGALGAFTASIGYRVTTASLGSWNHYAVSIYNSGSDLKSDLYVNGNINSRKTFADQKLGELTPKNMTGRLGALLVAPSGAWEGTSADGSGLSGAGKLSGSVDEFRYWKVARSAEEIGRNYFTQIRGGVNTDISNTTLGVYYKFNEGITGIAATDSVVLDFSGRVVNGAWTGYGSNSRNTGSAIVSASAASTEYRDPIIYSTHPDVKSVKASLLISGSYHDDTNNSAFKNLMPSWILDDEDNVPGTNLNKLSHIVGVYFDKLYLQIQAVPGFRNLEYTSGSYTPLPFARHLPQSLGLYMPELFIDSNVVERFLNRDEDSNFEGSLVETKNLIYLNLYNNLTNIFKSKGTEKAIRNVLRCMHVDDRLVRLNTYFKNQTYTLDNTLQQTVVDKSYLNLNDENNLAAVVYQRSSSAAAPAPVEGYIQGNFAQEKHGLTLEGDIVFPTYFRDDPKFHTSYSTASLFGMVQVHTGASATTTVDGGLVPARDNKDGIRTSYLKNDNVNFQLYAIRAPPDSKNAYFMVSSSLFRRPLPTLTSSIFYNVYDNENWNLSVRLKPVALATSGSTVHMGDMVAGGIVSGTSDFGYQLEFRGVNTELGVVKNSFLLTSSVSHVTGVRMCHMPKRIRVGADRWNVTGALTYRSNVEVGGIRYWPKYIEDVALDQHAYDVYNQGISGAYSQISPLDGGPSSDKYGNFEIFNYNALALSWDFNNITGSSAGGHINVLDLSSGSAMLSGNFGWMGYVAGQQHPGTGYGFAASSTDVTLDKSVNTFQFVDPEFAVSSDMINILSDDDKVFGIVEDVPDYFFSIEKSLYRAVSDEMLAFFAGIVDFNNIIGEAVYRYRMGYKSLEKLRQAFFEKVSDVKQVEKYIEYYKWFDDAISEIIGQLMPATAKFNADILNTVESHVLERNKYQNKFPTFEFNPGTLDTAMKGAYELSYPYRGGSAPTPVAVSPPRPGPFDGDGGKSAVWLQQRASPLHVSLSSGVTSVDTARLKIQQVIFSNPSLIQTEKTASRPQVAKLASPSKFSDKDAYVPDLYAERTFAKTELLVIDKPSGISPGGKESTADLFHNSPRGQANTGRWTAIHGGINFDAGKSADFADNALRPFGPVNHDDSVFVPENVLYSPTEDFTKFTFIKPYYTPEIKTKRHVKVQHGRNWELGIGYQSLKSNIVYPFNIMSSSVKSGFNKEVIEKVTGGIEITNLHSDYYGPDLEVPMQGPYTERFIGGHQSRHIPINTGALDTYLSRAERWMILLGKCPGISGALGMAGPDYPYPEANDELLGPPYPVTASRKAIYFRDQVAKRPVSLKNILRTTASEGIVMGGVLAHSPIGNYLKNYEVIQIGGRDQNPRKLVISSSKIIYPTVVKEIAAAHVPRGKRVLEQPVNTNIINNYLNLRRGEDYYFDWGLTYAPLIRTGSSNQSVMVQRFSAPGGPEVMSIGYLDIRGAEFSPYNCLSYRNMSVIKPSQGPSGSLSQPTGTLVASSSVVGMRVSDIHLKDYGLRSQLSRHTARFGRDSLFVTSANNLPGASYDQLPGFHKVHRNNTQRLTASYTITPIYSGSYLINSVGYDYGDSATNSTLLHTGANEVLELYHAFTSSGFTWTGWVNFAAANNGKEENVMYFGHMTSATPFCRIYKKYNNASDPKVWEFSVTLRTVDNSQNRRTTTWTMSASNDSGWSGSWNHFAFTWGCPAEGNVDTGLSSSTLYLNGVSQSVVASSTPRINYATSTATKNNFRGFADIDLRGFDYLYFGGGANNTEDPLSASIDEYTFWKTPLSAAHINEIYNGGVPCDITASSVYDQSASALWDWIRFEGTIGSGTAPVTIDSDNPGTYSSENEVNGYLGKRFIPLALETGDNPASTTSDVLTGCTRTFNGFSEKTNIVTSSLYDNFYVQHAIPRSDRQYAWVTAALDINPTATGQQIDTAGRYYGHAPIFGPQAGLYSASAGGWVSFFSYLTASSVTAHLKNASDEYTRVTNAIQPTYPLNIFIIDPISGTTNTMGQPAGNTSSSFGWYINTDMVNKLGIPTASNQELYNALYFNLLMTKRGNCYGWDWKKTRQQDNPILIEERKKNELSVISSSNQIPETFRMPPVSMRGRTAMLNFNNGDGTSPTLRMTSDNDEILFNELKLNNFVGVDLNTITTPFEQSLEMLSGPQLNWILYTQNLFPSLRNEFMSGTRTRLNYDNNFWRDSETLRTYIGSASGSVQAAASDLTRFPESERYPRNRPERLGFNSQGIRVSQSSWPLDAPLDFLTRSAPVSLIADSNPLPTGIGMLRDSGSGGELQNEYSFMFLSSSDFQVGSYNAGKVQVLAPAALFARPHMLSSPRSVVARSGIRIPETGSNIPGTDQSGLPTKQGLPTGYAARTADPSFDYRYQLKNALYGGAALWEASTKAGYVIQSGSGESLKYIFKSASSVPWFNNYDDFEYELGLMAKDYAVIPEFRISEHVEDYVKGGLFNEGKTDWCCLPGAKAFVGAEIATGEALGNRFAPGINSSTSSFFKDYSNSEFMRDFIKVNASSSLKPKEIMLVCSAAIRFNPYKGFYPAQRTIDIVSQFSKSYGASLAVRSYGGGKYPLPAPIFAGSNLFRVNQAIIGNVLPKASHYFAGGGLRALYQALYSPGILYNSVKAGMAVDYPVVLDSTKIGAFYYSSSQDFWDNGPVGATTPEKSLAGSWAITANETIVSASTANQAAEGYAGGEFFDKRIPFEAIIRPEEHIVGMDFLDMEPHPSASFVSRVQPGQTLTQSNGIQGGVTASLNAGGDQIYTLMAQNFFGEMGNFFLKGNTYSSLRSSVVPNDMRFESGSIYGARFKTYRSTTDRNYTFDSASGGGAKVETDEPWNDNPGFMTRGGGAISGGNFINGWYPIPQDPQRFCHETFTMYSRPTAFGPPIAGRPDFRILNAFNQPTASVIGHLLPFSMSYSGTMDCFNGYNWAYTPPYYHGEAWADFIFRPDPAKSYDLEQILAETVPVYTRVDPGPLCGQLFSSVSDENDPNEPSAVEANGLSPTLIIGSPYKWSHTSSWIPGGDLPLRGNVGHNIRPPYAGDNINANSMQCSASFNLFGVERVGPEVLSTEGKIVPTSPREQGKRWVIKPKYETPMFNFNDQGVHPITSGSETLTLPLYGSASVPRGIWHQFGIIEPDPAKGIFMEIGDIPEQWLKYHYNVINTSSIYNNFDLEGSGSTMFEKMGSLSKVVGFPRETPSARLGELTDYQTLREAIVIVPYVLEEIIAPTTGLGAYSDELKSTRKSFFHIPQERIDAALGRASAGPPEAAASLIAAGESIRKLVQAMPRYVLPPWLDFLNVEGIEPIVMYMLEFEYKLDKIDLSYIAQNIAPKDFRKITFESQSTAHTLLNTELLNDADILNNDHLRWMVFKVKQRSQSSYYDHVVPQVGEAGSKTLKVGTVTPPEYKLEFNWPYDYISFVEMIKIDAQVLYKADE